MSRYLASRASTASRSLMSFVVYLLIGLMPGDPIDMMIAGDPTMTSEDAARLRAVYGLDKPLLERYLAWAGAGAAGQLRLLALLQPAGAGRAVAAPAATRCCWPASPSCSSIAIALPLGIWAAAHPRSRADYLINLFCFAGISAPPFWLALLLITLFAVKLGWLPAGGMADVRPGTLVGDGAWSSSSAISPCRC